MIDFRSLVLIAMSQGKTDRLERVTCCGDPSRRVGDLKPDPEDR